MANTWTVYGSGIAFAASKVMWGLLNAGSNVIRLARMGLINNQTAAVTGVACLMQLMKYPTTCTYTPTTAFTPVAHDSTNTALSSVSVGTLGTMAGSTGVTIRRVFWSSDEPSISTATSDELECFIPLNVIWDAGYGDTDVQKLAIRTNEGFCCYNTTGAVGLVDLWGEITSASS